MQGTIKTLLVDRLFGTIESDGQEFFFHATALKGIDFSELMVGSPVVFEVDRDPKGDERGERPRAVNVELTEDAIPTSDNEPLTPEKVGQAPPD